MPTISAGYEFAHRDDYEGRKVIPSIVVDADTRNIEELKVELAELKLSNPTILASGLNWPGALAIDATDVYFTRGGTSANNYSDGAVMKVPIEGGMPIMLASGQRSPSGIAVDTSAVYWTDWGTFVGPSLDHALDTVMAVPLGGGSPVTLASGQNGPQGVAVDATNIYWTNSYGTVMRMPLGGGTPVALASGLDFPGSIAVDATSVYWVNGGTTGKPYGYTTLMKIPIAGGTPTTLASAGLIASGSSIAGDSASVYWTIAVYAASSGTTACTVGTVTKVPIAGGTPTTLAAGQNGPGAIAVDATAAYWLNQGVSDDGSLVRIPIAGGSAVTLASGQNVPMGIAVDGTYVYWTEAANGTVMKILKD